MFTFLVLFGMRNPLTGRTVTLCFQTTLHVRVCDTDWAEGNQLEAETLSTVRAHIRTLITHHERTVIVAAFGTHAQRHRSLHSAAQQRRSVETDLQLARTHAQM